MAVLTGSAPVAAMRDYQREVTAYTRGCGRLFCSLKGYEPCREPEKVIETAGYDPEGDMENPTGSVFCAHGAGFVVPWDQVEDYMHLEPVLKPAQKSERGAEDFSEKAARAGGKGYGASLQDDAELLEIFQRTYGKAGQERRGWNRSRNEGTGTSGLQVRDYGSGRDKKPEESYLLVDGYNIIFAWEDLKELAQVSLEGARGKLMDILCNYQGYRKMTLILVFDAYKVEGNVGEVMKYHNIHVIYTKEAETADQYIEKTVHRMGGRYDVTVATSDAAEQMIIWGQGARRLSARGLRREIREACQEIQENYLKTNPGAKHYLFENLGDDMAALMEEVRLGKKKL